MKVMFSEKYYKFIGDLGKITKRKKITLPELAISWLLYNENITSVICGVRSVELLKMNIKSANLLLDYDDLKQIDDAYSILISYITAHRRILEKNMHTYSIIKLYCIR